MPSKSVLVFLLIFLVIATFVVAYPWRSDVKRERFNTYPELQHSGLIERGWVPEFVPVTSENIVVEYNQDTNRTYLTFNLKSHDARVLITQLKNVGWKTSEKSTSTTEVRNTEYAVTVDREKGSVTVLSKPGGF